MRSLFLFLTFSIFSLSCFAQSKPQRQINEPNYYQEGSSQGIRMAGQHLKKYTRQFYLGTGLMAVGYTAASISLANAVANQNTNGGSVSGGAGVTIGGLMLLSGAIVQVLSHRHIGKAGELLERSALNQNLELQGSQTGVGLGLAYKF